jgi:hypothetical protein
MWDVLADLRNLFVLVFVSGIAIYAYNRGLEKGRAEKEAEIKERYEHLWREAWKWGHAAAELEAKHPELGEAHDSQEL